MSRFMAMGITEIYYIFSNDTQDTPPVGRQRLMEQQGFWQTPEGSEIGICKALLDIHIVLLLGL